MENFGKVCLAIMLSLVSIVFSGYVLLTLYDWFAVTSFNLPVISLVQAIGLRMLISVIQVAPKLTESELNMKTLVKNFSVNIMVGVITLLFAYLVHLMM